MLFMYFVKDLDKEMFFPFVLIPYESIFNINGLIIGHNLIITMIKMFDKYLFSSAIFISVSWTVHFFVTSSRPQIAWDVAEKKLIDKTKYSLDDVRKFIYKPKIFHLKIMETKTAILLDRIMHNRI